MYMNSFVPYIERCPLFGVPFIGAMYNYTVKPH